MSRLLEFFLHNQLKKMGWPRRKGVFRRQYVDLILADITIEQGLLTIVGLGAGRPEVAVAMVADTFAGNPWTEESTAELVGTLRMAEDTVTEHSDIPPWKALWHDHQMASYHKECSWSELFDDRVGLIRAMASSKAAWWGLTHHQEMQTLLDKEGAKYEKGAAEGREHGLEVSDKYPFESLERFYEWCDSIVLLSNVALQPLPPFAEISAHLKAVPEIARRIHSG